MADIVKLPDARPIRTCAVSFGGDWPGVFIRGDEACSFADRLRKVPDLHRGLQVEVLGELIDLLSSCLVPQDWDG